MTEPLPLKFVPSFGPFQSYSSTPQEHLLETTSIGSVLSAFGEGAKEGWGAEPLGLDDDSVQTLRDIGLFQSLNDTWINPLKGFNESLIRPAAAGIDAFFRAFPTVTGAVGKGLAEIGGGSESQKEKHAAEITEALNVGSLPLMTYSNAGGFVAAGEGPFRGTAPNVARVNNAVDNFDVVMAPKSVATADALAMPEAPGKVVEIGTVHEIGGGRIPEKGLVPSVVDKQGKIYYGEPGTIHSDILGWEAVAEYGFSGRDGKFLTRKDAASLLKDDDAIQAIIKEREQGDVIDARDLSKSTAPINTPKQEKLAAPLPVSPQAIEPQYTGKAGNINLDKLNTSDDVKGAIVEAAQANDDFMQARRGVVTWADTEALAEAAGIDASVLLKRNIGDAWNAHQIEAARNLLIESAKNVMEKRNAITKGENNDTALIDFQEAWTRHALIQEQVSGITSEAGRALNILRKKVGEAKEAGVNDLSDVLKELGGRTKAEEIIDALKGLDDPSKVSRFIADMQKPGALDYALEYLYNAMLSNPATHAANLTGNSLAQFWRVGETGVAGVIGATREAIGSRTAIAGDRVYLGEEGARLWGMLQSGPDALRAAWRAIKTETPREGAQKLEIDRPRAIPGPVGRAVRAPGTALMAADEFFKVVANRASINAQAYRKAVKAKLKGQDFADEVSRLSQSPTPGMMKRAAQEADYVTFTKELGKGGKAIQNLLAAHPILKFVVAPFFRTPVNLLKYAGERTPLSLASKEVREILMGKKGAAARDEQFAKILLGSTVMTATFSHAMEGGITGAGPSDPAERAMWLLSGKQPYSIKIGDTYYSYARLEPFATLMGISADAAEISNKLNVDEAANIGTLLAYSAGQNILNKTWTKGMSDVVEVLQDPERYGPAFVRQLVGRVVPAGVGNITRIDDPYLRDARNIVDGLRVKLPGLSDNVYPKRDIFGQAIRKDGAVGPDIVSPIFQSKLNNDPVVKELTTLGIFPAKLERQIRTVDLSEKQYDDYQRIAGRLMHIQLKNLIAVPGWQNVPTGIRQDVLNKAISKSRESARTLMLMQYPEIYKKALETRAKHMTGGK